MKIWQKAVACVSIIVGGQLAAGYIVWLGTGQWFQHTDAMAICGFMGMFLSLMASLFVFVEL